jgi:M3 family oligoendopeptidase
MKYAKSEDRVTRREAYEVLGNTLKKHSAQLDDIFDRLVHIRDRMAKKMGYENFVEMGDYRMGRLGYGRPELQKFRDNVEHDIVPVVARLRLENAKRLGLTELKLYDHDIIIPGGDPEPIGGKREVFQAALEMYQDMGEDTRRFFEFMLETDAFDVESRKNKWGGGYCTEFTAFKQPFILANFNGTSGDVDVVTHEAGHAFAAYMTADNRFAVELNVGGMETAETHSMSMEFFAWKYMKKFFGDQAEKYKFMHLMDALSFIPYGTIVDEFQRQVYQQPDLTPEQRKEVWRNLEAKFRPYVSAEGIPYLEEGTRWQYQMHIYETPFYYIDYCLAQTAALQFLMASRKDYADAYARYVHLLSQGGEKTFGELLEEAGLRSPFEDGALQSLAKEAEQFLEVLAAQTKI